MAVLTTEEIIEATGGKLLSGDLKSPEHFRGVSIDSRTISDGEIFFTLRGQRFDAHDFLKEALLKGDGAVVDIKPQEVSDGKVIIYVDDTLRALQDLAHFLRLKQDIPVIAITGSNGKTTTKEMLYAILSKRFKVIKNEGNLNNHIGLPLSLTRIAPDDEAAVLELGMNASGEIRRLCEIAVPTYGVITNIGSAHIGNLGSLESIRSAKLEILKGLAAIILNADDSFLMQGYESIRTQGGFDARLITFSMHNDSDVKAEDVVLTDYGSSFRLKVKQIPAYPPLVKRGRGDFQNKEEGSISITLNVHGLFNVYNALAASAVCLSLGMSLEEIKTALESYKAFPMRFEVVRRNSITLINDSYNANPSSMKEALKELVHMKGEGRAVAVLGDMLELGEFSGKAHSDIIKMAADMGINIFVAVGEMMSLAAEKSREEINQKLGSNSGFTIYAFNNADEAQQNISGIIKQSDVVLIKGSRAMGMERIIERIRG
ncbi:MAG: UDP-N-acetylmuramoyl-tripeptide--D-alanyl-D-alanine ligase [Nitrospirae bacterium]|nr:UDP-N-acetylmuramoyl-tripeptide--D-alanyl-D-alanine ligase [Nitrospirota bacterium]